MIPNATQERAEALLKMYAEAEEYLLSIVSKHIGSPSGDVPRWVQLKLSQVQSVQKDLRTAVDGLAERSLAERIKLMWAAHDEGADGLFRELGIDDARATRSQSVVTLIDDTNQRFSELHRRILRDATDTYRDVLSKALPLANMGVETTQQAIRRVLNAFADRGITAFVDKAGRRWGMAEYAEMATRTGMMLSSIAGYTQEALNHSEDLVIISDHWDECPLCAQWERAVLSLTGATPGYPTVADARAGGLFHPNCLHSMTVYVPGLTDTRGQKTGNRTREQDAAGYDNRQKQRYIERTIRRWKRRQAVATTPEEERIAKAYVGKWQRALRELVGDTKLPRKYSREGGRVLLSEAAKRLKPLKFSENGGIMKSERDTESERIINLILSNSTIKTINPEKQNRHILGAKEYTQGRSYIYGDLVKAQQLVDRYHGTGDVVFDRKGNWKNKEIVNAENDIGVDINPSNGEKAPTNRFIIHYSKTGVHIVPTSKKE